MANNGMKGKFRDRLKLIVIRRRKYLKGIVSNREDKKDVVDDSNRDVRDNDKFIQDRINYIRKKLAEDRENNLGNGYGVRKKKVGIGEEVDNKKVNINNKRGSIDKNSVDVKKNDVVVSKDKDVDNKNKNGYIGNVNKYRRNKVRRRVGIGSEDVSDVISNGNIKRKDEVKKELGTKIIKKIKGKLEDNINELDVLESELFFLERDNNKELELKKVEEIRKKIEGILKKIEEIKREYEIFRNNYYLEDVTDLDDSLLIDDIIDYKRLLDSYDDNRELVKEYKLLDEYRELYDKLDEISSIRERVVSENESKIVDYKERDKKYKVICDKVIKIDDIKSGVEEDIDKQNRYLDGLMDKISKIDKNEYSIYKVKGLGELIGHSLKYVGLMMISPLLGFLPGITASTIATRNMIRNIRDNMRVEEIKRVRYVAVDFNSEINNKLNDIDYTYYVIDDTLSEISRLKRDFLRQYNSNIDGYYDTLNKINMIEGNVINNRKKVDIIKRKMISSKKINEDKMMLVRELNKDN